MQEIDLSLWKNEELIRRQNQLKYQFWDLLGKVGDEFSQEYLKKIHPDSKGKKLSQGQDLEGLPYQVLDLVRDFDFNTGLNIRILNWFGRGAFLFVLVGKENFPMLDLSSIGFKKCLTESPWDYPKILSQDSEIQSISDDLEYQQWFKELEVYSQSEENLANWKGNIQEVFDFLF
ncbi:MAG: hypothetical protein HWE15_03320 [Algoriphagus sp.]|uniref:hypothetical protein n=1 Tax=Algoriphagus sp. TaxID=1872435 RepID=UPI001829A128|nr:hypothetical protein [Algoriphagus sp.]NVJ85305.1 hypothetical protein [Algoriphagus sp.]